MGGQDWNRGLRSAEQKRSGTATAREKDAASARDARQEQNAEPERTTPPPAPDSARSRLIPRIHPAGPRLGPSPQQGASSSSKAVSSVPVPGLQLGHLRTPRNTQRLHSVENSPLDIADSPRGSVMSLDFSNIDDEAEGESVQVFVRVRPHNTEELRLGSETTCLQAVGMRSVMCAANNRGEPRTYTFDQVLWKSSQDEVFEVTGMPMVDNCMAGYNSSIFAYGQTGAGKTFTMMGQLAAPPTGAAGAGASAGASSGAEHGAASDLRGLAPRVFEYLFQKISVEEDDKGRDNVRYSCRCSFLEIYNETITDLLNPAAHNLNIREDVNRGCFVEGLSETQVLNVDDVLSLMKRGAENRHVGETRMNRESSRSHSVFTCTVEKSSKAQNGVTSVICSRLNLIDLAGSERIRGGAMGGSNVQGDHFKEAVHINKSLTTLGRVIMELVEAQRTGRKGRHIPYRDSRLTFLLQDSLGGNAKTMIIANVSPSMLCAAETSSTLQFVQRAKCIRNKATINLDYRGDVKLLQAEIVRLNTELDNLRKGFTDPMVQENAELRKQLEDEQRKAKDMELRISSLATENHRFRRERQRLEERVTCAQNQNGRLEELVARLEKQADVAESASRRRADLAATERSLLERQAELLNAELAASRELTAELEAALAQAREAAAAEAKELRAKVAEAEDSAATLAGLYAKAQEDLAAERAARLEVEATLAELRSALESERGEKEAAHALIAALRVQLEAAAAADEAARGELGERDSLVGSLQAQLQEAEAAAKAAAAAAADEVAGLKGKLAEQEATEQELAEEVADMYAKLETERAAHAATKGALEAARVLATDERAALSAEAEEARERVGDLEGQLASEKEWAEALADKVHSLEEAAELAAARTAELEAQVSELRATLAAAEAEKERRGEVVAELRAAMETQGAAAGAREAELSRALEGAGASATERGQQVERLEQELASLEASTAAAIADLQASLAATTAGKSAAEADAADRGREAAELRAAVSELGSNLGDAKKELAELRQRLEGSSAASQELGGELERAKGALAAARAELVGAKHSLAEEARAHAEVRSALAAKERALSDTQRAVRDLESHAAAMAAQQAAQISTLQKELIKSQEELVAREFELKAQVERLSAEVGSLRKEHGGLASRLEDKGSELAAVKQSLAAQQDALAQAQALLAERERELADSRREALEADARHAIDQTTIHELSMELQQYRSGKGDLENQLKTNLVINTRQNRAFQEIRRLIEWATTPASSMRSSLAMRNGEGGTPMSTATGLTGFDGAASPAPSNLAAAFASASATPTAHHTGATPGLEPSTTPGSMPFTSPAGLKLKNAHSIASLYRLRSSLAEAGLEGALACSPRGTPYSPKGGGVSPGPRVRARALDLSSPRASLAALGVSFGSVSGGAVTGAFGLAGAVAAAAAAASGKAEGGAGPQEAQEQAQAQVQGPQGNNHTHNGQLSESKEAGQRHSLEQRGEAAGAGAGAGPAPKEALRNSLKEQLSLKELNHMMAKSPRASFALRASLAALAAEGLNGAGVVGGSGELQLSGKAQDDDINSPMALRSSRDQGGMMATAQ